MGNIYVCTVVHKEKERFTHGIWFTIRMESLVSKTLEYQNKSDKVTVVDLPYQPKISL